MKRVIVVLAVLSLIGCDRAEVSQETYTATTSQTFQSLLVCAEIEDAAAEAQFESVLSERLKKHGIRATPCVDVSPENRQAFESMLLLQSLPGAPVRFRASLISLRDKQTVWDVEGVLEGDQDAPPQLVLPIFARLIDRELKVAGVMASRPTATGTVSVIPKSAPCPTC